MYEDKIFLMTLIAIDFVFSRPAGSGLGQRQITDIFTIDVNKVVASDKVPCNNVKDCCYIVGYQVDGGTGTTVYQDT